MNSLTGCVLVVDDEPIIAGLWRVHVEDMGLNVCGVAATAASAIVLAEQHKPSVIIMDVRLRGKRDGVDAALAINQTLRSKIIFVTGSRESETMARISLARPAAVLYKPVSDHQLKSAIKFAMETAGFATPPEDQDVTLATVSAGPDGATPRTAICIQADSSAEGIPMEYDILNAMLGDLSRDWDLIERSIIHTDDNRKLERFVVGIGEIRRDIYFDVTDWIGNESWEASFKLESLIAAGNNPVSVRLPKEELLALQMCLVHLTDGQLRQLGISPMELSAMVDPFFAAVRPYRGKVYAIIPPHLDVTMLMSLWIDVYNLLSEWEPANDAQEEEFDDLKSIISETLITAGSATQ